jgi:phosphinothricin acetyltransferase
MSAPDEARAIGKHMIAAIDGANMASISSISAWLRPSGSHAEVGAKFGRWQELVLMQLRLDDRAAPDDG